MRQSARAASSRRSTSGRRPGNLGGAEQAERIRREGGWLGRGPTVVVTDLGIYHFDDAGEMRLDSLHPGATVEDVRDDHRLGRSRSRRTSATTPPPTAEELRLIREELDPRASTRSSRRSDSVTPSRR